MCTYGLLQTVCWKGRLSRAASSNEFHGMVGYTHNVHVYIYIMPHTVSRHQTPPILLLRRVQ